VQAAGQQAVPGLAGTSVALDAEKRRNLVRAAALFSLLSMTAFGSSILPSSGPGTTPGDLFDVSNGTVVDSNSPTISGYDILDMFGATLGTGSEGPGVVLFADDNTDPWPVSGNPADYFVTFTTSSAITLSSFDLYLQDDFNGTADRTVSDFQLYAGSTLVSNVTILAPGQVNYDTAYGSDTIVVSDTFAPVVSNTFTAVFTDNPLASSTADGPRVLGLDGFGPTGTVPEPSTVVLMGAGILALLLVRRGHGVVLFGR
jgi:hypothetical protein